MDEGMPFEPYKKEIIEFSELFQFCKEFNTTPDKIIEWKKKDPYLFHSFRHFLSGMSRVDKDKGGDYGSNNNRHHGKLGKVKK